MVWGDFVFGVDVDGGGKVVGRHGVVLGKGADLKNFEKRRAKSNQ